jgi:hypothetical protein
MSVIPVITPLKPSCLLLNKPLALSVAEPTLKSSFLFLPLIAKQPLLFLKRAKSFAKTPKKDSAPVTLGQTMEKDFYETRTYLLCGLKLRTQGRQFGDRTPEYLQKRN